MVAVLHVVNALVNPFAFVVTDISNVANKSKRGRRKCIFSGIVCSIILWA